MTSALLEGHFEIRIDLGYPGDLIEGSPRDAIDITIEDNRVVVYGTSVPGFEQVFSR